MITIETPPLELTKKLAVVVSEKIEIGTAMNAVAHMALGMGSLLGPDESLMCDYRDADGISHPFISAYPFIVLKGHPNKIREAIDAAKNCDVKVIDFISSMTIGTYTEQLNRTHALPNADLEFYGAVFFGNTDSVSAITKKFSLYK
jgi:hypothetical protein